MKTTLTDAQVDELADYLDAAQQEVRGVSKVTDRYPEMTWADAYAVQEGLKARALARGEQLVALKMGLTSRAKMKQMGVESPIRGYLTDAHWVAQGEAIKVEGQLIHPKVEPELAFITTSELKGPGVTREQALEAIGSVVPALEIIDSRYENFRFDLTSVIADNTSAARYLIGSASSRPQDLDLRALGVVFEKNGEMVATGAAAAVLGHPADSLAELANMLAEYGESVPADTLVLTGGITAAVRVDAGDVVSARFQDLGTLSVRFV